MWSGVTASRKRGSRKTDAAFYEETGALRDMVANHRFVAAVECMEASPVGVGRGREGKVNQVKVFFDPSPRRVDDVPRFTVRGRMVMA